MSDAIQSAKIRTRSISMLPATATGAIASDTWQDSAQHGPETQRNLFFYRKTDGMGGHPV